MILCVCHAVSSNNVRQLIDCRVSYDQIVKITGATSNCGICTCDFDKFYMEQLYGPSIEPNMKYNTPQDDIDIVTAKVEAKFRLELHELRERCTTLQRLVLSYTNERQEIACTLDKLGLSLQPDGIILKKAPHDQTQETNSLSPLLPAREGLPPRS